MTFIDGPTLSPAAYFGHSADSPIWRQIAEERARQEAIGEEKQASGIDWRSCADPEMDGGDFARATVLGEEYGEACQAALELTYARSLSSRAPADPLGQGLVKGWERDLRKELIQVAAVAVAWIEAIDARGRDDG